MSSGKEIRELTALMEMSVSVRDVKVAINSQSWALEHADMHVAALYLAGVENAINRVIKKYDASLTPASS